MAMSNPLSLAERPEQPLDSALPWIAALGGAILLTDWLDGLATKTSSLDVSLALVDIGTRDLYGSPLQAVCLGVSADREAIELIRFLVEKAKADVNYVSGRYGTALGTACLQSSPDVPNVLLSGCKANTRLRDWAGRLPVTWLPRRSLAGFDSWLVSKVMTTQASWIKPAVPSCTGKLTQTKLVIGISYSCKSCGLNLCFKCYGHREELIPDLEAPSHDFEAIQPVVEDVDVPLAGEDSPVTPSADDSDDSMDGFL
ncbi:hypothetical protein B0T25DRAFT_124830 [Lasiosphaeria hispida]|uniref:Uncharacterized protein n=1 Tax=Lasiosphaeria hispida TaxID=260671 RepID=A0AAJ0HRQ0_9PEZI|nr:hypothetical protein B0T25DRAFT_124830 [Lasiosphaeria hispida]